MFSGAARCRLLVLLVLACGALLSGGARLAGADPLLAASGDIACAPGSAAGATDCQQSATASLIASQSPTAVAVVGDEQYEHGLYSEFTGAGAYDATWGAFKSISHPVPGNHEYDQSSSAAGYFQYFGSLAGPSSGYYSYDLGGWHLIALNSNCSDSDTPSCQNFEGAGAMPAAEVQWLRDDLAAHQGQCTLAYWHHPRFSQGHVGDSAALAPAWQALYDHGADVVVSGHDHVYERYAELGTSGSADAVRGVREFVAGEGGNSLPGFPGTPTAPVQAWDGTHFGVLFLTLHPSSYDWKFVSITGVTLDQGSGTGCHEPQVAPATTPAAPTTGQSVAFDAHPSVGDGSTISTYSWDFGDGSSSSSAATPSHVYATAGTYTASVSVTASNGVSTTKSFAVAVSDRPPVASFTESPSSAPTGQAISFDGSGSSDPDGTISSYSWDFGDGATSTAASPSHSYTTAGSYTVKLTVTDNSGNTNSTTKSVTITDRPPAASFTATPSSAPTGQAISFDGSGSSDPDGTISSYSWDFGDGSTATGSTTTHAYGRPGNYTAKLTVIDDDGSATATTQTVTVIPLSLSLHVPDRRLLHAEHLGLLLSLSSNAPGRLTLRLTAPGSHRRTVSLGGTTVGFAGARSTTARVHLDRRALRGLRATRTLRVRAAATWNGAPAAAWQFSLVR